jgi:Ca-activated chloride channel family protein
MMLHWIRPDWFWLLLPVIATAGLLLRQQHSASAWKKYCDPHLQPHVLQNTGTQRVRWWWFWFSLCLLSSIIAMAGPSWQRLSTPVYRTANARVIVLDLSNSMLANDLAPNRLARAKYKILDLLRATQEGQTGMVVFSSQAFVVSPLTDDSNTIAAMVPSLNTTTVPVQGQNIAAGLQAAQTLLQQAGAQTGQVILITGSPVTSNDEDAAQQLAKQAYHLTVMGVGTERGGPIPKLSGGFITNASGAIEFAKLDLPGLENLAHTGAGQYVPFTNSNQDISRLLGENVKARLTDKFKQTEQAKTVWRDDGHWFIWLAILAFLPLIRRGWWENVA